MTNAKGPKTAATKEAHSGKSAPPLTGLRVIDLTSVIFGPMATSMLAELGADVIKVEPPSGDIMRHVEPIRSPGMSAIYMNANRGKRSVVIDLKKPSGREALLRLAETADVFVHSMRNSAATRLGITYDDIRGLNPALIYCFACGFGSTGPYAELPAYDDIIQAACGLASLAGAADAREAGAILGLGERAAGDDHARHRGGGALVQGRPEVAGEVVQEELQGRGVGRPSVPDAQTRDQRDVLAGRRRRVLLQRHDAGELVDGPEGAEGRA